MIPIYLLKFQYYKIDRNYLWKVFLVSNAIVIVMLVINPVIALIIGMLVIPSSSLIEQLLVGLYH